MQAEQGRAEAAVLRCILGPVCLVDVTSPSIGKTRDERRATFTLLCKHRMLEAWADAAALEAHGQAAPFTRLAARFDDLLMSPPDLRRLEHLA